MFIKFKGVPKEGQEDRNLTEFAQSTNIVGVCVLRGSREAHLIKTTKATMLDFTFDEAVRHIKNECQLLNLVEIPVSDKDGEFERIALCENHIIEIDCGVSTDDDQEIVGVKYVKDGAFCNEGQVIASAGTPEEIARLFSGEKDDCSHAKADQG